MAVADDSVIKRLDTIIAIMRLVHGEKLDLAREQILADKTNKAILQLTADWRGAGDLQNAVTKQTGESGSTVKRRLAVLVDQGVLERRGAGPQVAYRSTGLI